MPHPLHRLQILHALPNGVNIPHNFGMFNNGAMYDKWDDSRKWYTGGRFPEAERASACIQCRECEDKCPQKIEISQWMPYVHQVLGEGKPHEQGVCP